MAIEITHVRFSGTNRVVTEIIAYQWVSLDNVKVACSNKPTLVEWVDGSGKAYWTNNLESLPTF